MRPYLPEPALAALAALTILAGAPDARACSCAGPRGRLLTPDRLDAAPLNARVRLELPAGRAGWRVLRAHGSTVEVPVSERKIPAGNVEVVELVPRAPLSPSTRYEVAYVDPDQRPSTLVMGTFITGTAADTAAPVLRSGGVAEAHRGPPFGGGSCSIPGPWIDVTGAVAEDPGRPDAQILWGIWPSAASGKIDATRPPALIVQAWQGTVTLGRRSGCDPHDFPLPATGVFSFRMAALDEAGNAGPLKTHRVDLGAAKPGPHP